MLGRGSFAPGNADGGLTTQEENGWGPIPRAVRLGFQASSSRAKGLAKGGYLLDSEVRF